VRKRDAVEDAGRTKSGKRRVSLGGSRGGWKGPTSNESRSLPVLPSAPPPRAVGTSRPDDNVARNANALITLDPRINRRGVLIARGLSRVAERQAARNGERPLSFPLAPPPSVRLVERIRRSRIPGSCRSLERGARDARTVVRLGALDSLGWGISTGEAARTCAPSLRLPPSPSSSSERFMRSRARVERIFQGRATEGTNFQTAGCGDV